MDNLSDEKINAKIKSLYEILFKRQKEKNRKNNLKLFGKCFKYKNSYSCPEKESDYWYIFKQIHTIHSDGGISGLMFQSDSKGKIVIEVETEFHPDVLGEEISIDEFNHYWKEMIYNITGVR